MEPKSLGRRIKAARVLSGLSRKQVAEMIDYGPDQLGAYERGDQTPKEPVLLAIAQATGVSRAFFTEDFSALLSGGGQAEAFARSIEEAADQERKRGRGKSGEADASSG